MGNILMTSPHVINVQKILLREGQMQPSAFLSIVIFQVELTGAF